MDMYKYKVKWCPVCNQGWVQIVKEKESGTLFVCCSECETEWSNPEEIQIENGTQCVYGSTEELTMDEVRKIGWEGALC